MSVGRQFNVRPDRVDRRRRASSSVAANFVVLSYYPNQAGMRPRHYFGERAMGSRVFRSGVTCVIVVVTSMALSAKAQDKPGAEQLQKMYDDALNTLKAAQDRKNELATENERLVGRINELEKQLQSSRRELAERDRESFFLRSYYASWQHFLERYPTLKSRWEVFLKAPPLAQPYNLPEVHDPNWPLSAAG